MHPSYDGVVQERGTKKERREVARKERERLQRAIERRRRLRRIGVGAIVVSLLLAGVAAIVISRGSGGADEPSTVAPEAHVLDGPPPWPANTEGLAVRLAETGLPALTAMEQLEYHIHAHLDVLVDGKPVTVPANIGIDPTVGIAVLHTHDERGVIHVEAPQPGDFTLGQFFDVWGVRLTQSCIGGACSEGDASLTAFVNGKQVTGDPGSIVLGAHDEIVLAFGTETQLPDPVPSSFEFAPGE
jgi:hypothetical protein